MDSQQGTRPITPHERYLNSRLRYLPAEFSHRWSDAADQALKRLLFSSLVPEPQHWRLLFPAGKPDSEAEQAWNLSKAQGAVDGAEYTAAAKGTACGHIFKANESTYHCSTCAADDTCVLCARCFDCSDHEGHQVFISVSPGNSGCCDCGDHEAWKRPVHCSIHTADPTAQGKQKGRISDTNGLPAEVARAIETTVARAMDYMCDVFSCSPEQLRLPKTEGSIRRDEKLSRLSSKFYGEDKDEGGDEIEYALVLWNDEKHTVDDVRNQVARACAETKTFGFRKAMEVNDVGRSVVHYSTDLEELLRMAGVIEQLKVTVTIRSSRDTFREQMCASIIDWILDIAGCSVGEEPHLLKNIVCQQLLEAWRPGSEATNRDIGMAGIDDHEYEDNQQTRQQFRHWLRPFAPAANVVRVEIEPQEEDEEDDDYNDDGDEDVEYDMDEDNEGMEIDIEDMQAIVEQAADVDMRDPDFEDNDDIETNEALFAGYPPPPPPPANRRRRILTPADSDEGEIDISQPSQTRPEADAPFGNVPKTPMTSGKERRKNRPMRPSKHWLEKPEGYRAPRPVQACEDLWQRVRLDFLILYDLRMWKTLRINIRHLYITTVVTIPTFKRILGLRFAGLYTTLAQLYLIADREPDHSIINLSVQMLTTPTITQEVVERGNFLTNLMAILYTFLTTRQVGFPEDVNPRATLAFDAGAVTNRRMFHFFLDLRWLFQSEFILWRMRVEPRYLLQFLDLVKLHQGICPNQRQTGEHIEYESDAWISASMIIKEVDKLCKQCAVAFDQKNEHGVTNLQRATRVVAQTVMINSFGYERNRFHNHELKGDLGFHHIGPFEFDKEAGMFLVYSVPTFVVQKQPMSFHHPLHYLLSWLIEDGKTMDRAEMRALLQFDYNDLKDPWHMVKSIDIPQTLTSDELLSAIFDHPLRVCVWLAQMRAGMWVRNGITLRHQMHTYRNVTQREVSYSRDIFMIQAGLVICGKDQEPDGSRFLAQILDRFQMTAWIQGDYTTQDGFEEQQQLDVVEDFFHLLIIALSDRGSLMPDADEGEQHIRALQHDIAHTLCFKPLSFSELSNRLPDRIADADEFQDVLRDMAVFRQPEGLTDSGLFELKPEHTELLNPYFAHYTRNQREDAEAIYKKHMATKTGKQPADIVFEPTLQPIASGLFADLAGFTRTGLLGQVVFNALRFALGFRVHSAKIQITRIETFLQIVLHLILIAVLEDKSSETEINSPWSLGFIKLATSAQAESLVAGHHHTIASLLAVLSSVEDYASCTPAIKLILQRMSEKHPRKVALATNGFGTVTGREASGSPASLSEVDKEKKKKASLARQTRVMAQMRAQQNNFMATQGLAQFGKPLDDFEGAELDQSDSRVTEKKSWSFPSGTCILCQEETDEHRLSGTFAYFGDSNIVRPTPLEDMEYVEEIMEIPDSLDRPAVEIRPFGVAGKNKRMVEKIAGDGTTMTFERQGLSRGFPPPEIDHRGPVSTSCGHIMHYSCFELYLAATQRRHAQQIARNHPERVEKKEFICPLCKALGNTFLPIVWKPKECATSAELYSASTFDASAFTTPVKQVSDFSRMNDHERGAKSLHTIAGEYTKYAHEYVSKTFTPTLLASMQDLAVTRSTTPPPTSGIRRSFQLPALLRFRHDDHRATTALSESPSSPEQQARMLELVKAYKRIDETARANGLHHEPTSVEDFKALRSLSEALGFSISAVEIAHRGVGSGALSLLEDLPEQTVTHLRILSETVSSYIAIGALRSQVTHMFAKDLIGQREIMAIELLDLGRDMRGVDDVLVEDVLDRLGILFQRDTFIFFAEYVAYIPSDLTSRSCPSPLIQAYDVLRICYWAEVVKVIQQLHQHLSGVAKDIPGTLLTTNDNYSTEGVSESFKLAVNRIAAEDERYTSEEQQLNSTQYAQLRCALDKYAVTFLRKAIILLHVRFGLDFQDVQGVSLETPELYRLTMLLNLPSLEQYFAQYTKAHVQGNELRSITRYWIQQSIEVMVSEMDGASSIMLSHPAIFELVGLPKNYDLLTEEAVRRRCPTTGKDVQDPAICLFCGDIFCSQAVCCMKDRNKGGCFQHSLRCGGNVGMFLNTRKCMVLFMHGGHGSWWNAPYLDKHGEVDPTLRRHHQLYLNQKRYDKLLREVWLNHMIPSAISRRLESDINPGGWETL